MQLAGYNGAHTKRFSVRQQQTRQLQQLSPTQLRRIFVQRFDVATVAPLNISANNPKIAKSLFPVSIPWYSTKMFHWSLIVSLLGLLTAALGAYCGWFLFPNMVDKKVEESVIIADGSEQYKRFVQLPQPLTFKVYIFNVTNAHKIQQGAIPIVEEIGPYVYRQYRRKKVKHFSRDGSKISYVQDQHFEFDEEASAPYTQSDHIVVLNMHMNSVLTIAENDPGLSLLLVHLNANLKAVFNDPKSMFLDTTVREFLFDGVRFCINTNGIAKAICNQIKEGGSKTIRELSDGSLAFSFFNHKNGTGNEVYEVHTGKGDAQRVLEIQKLDDSHNLQVWLNGSEGETSMCNQINGTDASSYPPFRKRGDSMYIFSADICRSVQLFYQSDIQYQGIPGFRYSIGENFINDIGPEHDNECFCVDKLANVIKRKNGCLYAGALDLTTCLDAPVILTLPHMLGASNEYTKMIRGLRPDAKKHQTFVDVQHLTGTPLQGGKRVQFNMFLKSINRISITENLTTVLMPAIWVEEGIQLNSEMVAFFKKKLINSLKTLNIIHWASICGGIGVAAICLIYYVIQRRKPEAEVAPLK
ncbi:sensory neuron membrane protein 2 isoform X3 [Bactrocera neohumeralis]|uniref:sensory neuron membrane protein 2 isoform X5 n=1 Tax=Bactrocera tryoni TaxID=59916 RepID=UPI001A97EE03|nr:sensory neuron membrane protein 2 isoform X5 [Bactrocera tryoni]XP_050333392.1 sensory neuron membrane protein 2 isoform X3 [Bactrocera neohumeralis]